MPERNNVLVFSAHAADFVWRAGGAIALYASRGYRVRILCLSLATSLYARGVVGLVIDAGVRDVSELTAIRFPVWAKAVSAQGTVKASAGSVNIPVVCGGALVNPGDIIVGDADGVVVVPRAHSQSVARAGSDRAAKEERTRERLRNGELGVDFYGLREKLKQLGVEYVDADEDEAFQGSNA